MERHRQQYLNLPGIANPLFSIVFHEHCLVSSKKSNDCACAEHALNVPAVSDIERIGFHYVMPTVCCVGIVLNLLTLFVLYRKLYWAPSFIFLRGITAADLLTTTVTFIYGISYCFNCPNNTAGFLRAFYQVYVYLPVTSCSETVSAWMTVVLALERTLLMQDIGEAMTYPITRHNAYVLITLMIAAGVTLNSPLFFSMRINDDNMREFTQFGNSQAFRVYSWTRASLTHFVPLLVLSVLNVILMVDIRRSKQRSRKISIIWSTASRRETTRRRITAMLSGTIVLFLCGNIPLAFAYWPLFEALFPDSHYAADTYAIYKVVTHNLALLSYGLDFFVYYGLNRRFRDDFYRTFQHRWGKSKVGVGDGLFMLRPSVPPVSVPAFNDRPSSASSSKEAGREGGEGVGWGRGGGGDVKRKTMGF